MKLHAAQRNALPGSSFAGPDRSYPIEDANHARNALARVAQHGSPALQARVRSAVHRRYPGIGVQGRAFGGPVAPGHSYIVGEQGPEMFQPHAAGMIHPMQHPAMRQHYANALRAHIMAGLTGAGPHGRVI
jgi:hypothetical protein